MCRSVADSRCSEGIVSPKLKLRAREYALRRQACTSGYGAERGVHFAEPASVPCIGVSAATDGARWKD
jgi:hypothetical protein